jgi:hypothetical protein
MWMPRTRAGVARTIPDPAAARAKVDEDLRALQSMIEADLKAGLPIPWDYEELYHRWHDVHPRPTLVPLRPPHLRGVWYVRAAAS